jgi:hypothetical protein
MNTSRPEPFVSFKTADYNSVRAYAATRGFHVGNTTTDVRYPRFTVTGLQTNFDFSGFSYNFSSLKAVSEFLAYKPVVGPGVAAQ